VGFVVTSREYDPVAKKFLLYNAANTELAAAAYNAGLTASPVPVRSSGSDVDASSEGSPKEVAQDGHELRRC
jgi:hypothetical protein